MEFFIKKGANLPAIRLLVVQDGRSDYVRLMETLVDSKVFFSMSDAATGIVKIALAPCEVIPFYQPDGTIEYYINFKFSNRDTNNAGRYKGEFTIKNPDGTRILPLREEIFINVQDTFVSIDNCCTDTISNLNSLQLIVEVFYGSVDIVYTLTSFKPVPVNIRVDFTNVFYTYTGSPLTVTTGVTINAGNKVGTTYVNFPDEDPNNLTRIATISNIVIIPSQLSNSFNIVEEIIFPTQTPTPSVTSQPTPTPTLTPTQTEQIITDAIITNDGDYIKVGDGIYLKFIDPTPTPTPTQTKTPTPTPTEQVITDAILTNTGDYIKVGDGIYLMFIQPTPLPTITPTITSTVTPTTSPFYYYYNLLDCDSSNNKIGRSIIGGLSGTYNVEPNKCYLIVGILFSSSYDYDLDTSTLVTNCTDFLCGLVSPSPTPTNTQTPTSTPISCLDIATNGDGGLVGWNPTAFAIAPNPNIGTTYPVGSQILFQNGEIRTIVFIDDYSPLYIDIFYDSPISTGTLFPITICYPSIPTPTSTPTPTTLIICDTFTFTGNNVTTTVNSVIKTSSGGWDSSAYSVESYTSPISVSFQISNGNSYLMGGFSYNPNANPGNTYVDISYGLYIQPNFLEIYENGNQATILGSMTNTISDVWKVDYDGINVKYYKNGNLIYTSSNPVTQPLHIYFPILTMGDGVTNVCVIETPLPTPTQTNTETPTPTPTETPTPTPTITPNCVRQIVVPTLWNGATSINSNTLQLTQTSETLQIQVNDVITDNIGATSFVGIVSSDGTYTYVFTGPGGGVAFDCQFPLTFSGSC